MCEVPMKTRGIVKRLKTTSCELQLKAQEKCILKVHSCWGSAEKQGELLVCCIGKYIRIKKQKQNDQTKNSTQSGKMK